MDEAAGTRSLPLPCADRRPCRSHARRDGRHSRGHRPEPRPQTTAIRSAGGVACLKSRSQAIIYCEFVVTSAGSVRTMGMTTTPGELPTDLETCHQLIRELLESLSRQSCLNEKLQHQLEQLLRRIYGRKSEKLDPNQLLLFAREIVEATG